jgi:hypothetical protein
VRSDGVPAPTGGGDIQRRRANQDGEGLAVCVRSYVLPGDKRVRLVVGTHYATRSTRRVGELPPSSTARPSRAGSRN